MPYLPLPLMSEVPSTGTHSLLQGDVPEHRSPCGGAAGGCWCRRRRTRPRRRGAAWRSDNRTQLTYRSTKTGWERQVLRARVATTCNVEDVRSFVTGSGVVLVMELNQKASP